jgi:hypothetical protein
MKINRNFNAFTDLKSLELEVPTICLATGCVSLRRDRRYLVESILELVEEETVFMSDRDKGIAALDYILGEKINRAICAYG